MAGLNVDGLTPKQEQAVLALLDEASIAQAARTVGVGERTVHRWLAEPGFARAYRTARRRAFSQAVGMTQRYAPVAVQVLVQIMADREAPHGSRVEAAKTILRVGREGIELEDLAERVEALERAADPALGAAA